MIFCTIPAGVLAWRIVPALKTAPEPSSAAHWTLTETVSVNGDFSPSVGSGDYTVKADCTGSLMLRASGSTAARHMSVILLNHGSEIHTIVGNLGNITTAVLKSIESRQCSNSTLKGDYSYVQNGTVVGEGPFASPGFTRFDGEGDLTTIEFTSRKGMIAPDPERVILGSGTYGTAPDLRPPPAGAGIW